MGARGVRREYPILTEARHTRTTPSRSEPWRRSSRWPSTGEWLKTPERSAPAFRGCGQGRRVQPLRRASQAGTGLTWGRWGQVGPPLLRHPGSKAEVAATPTEAAKAASRIGFPVVMKIASPDILHKSDVGGVLVGLKSPEEVAESYHSMMARVRQRVPDADIRGVTINQMIPKGREVIIGMSRDPQFGPMLMFGLGGHLRRGAEGRHLPNRTRSMRSKPGA